MIMINLILANYSFVYLVGRLSESFQINDLLISGRVQSTVRLFTFILDLFDSTNETKGLKIIVSINY